MIDLNNLCKVTLENAKKRQENGAHIKTDTKSMLKHCATEVLEAMEAFTILQNFDCTSVDAQHFEMELADVICCILIICGIEYINIEGAIMECIEKNRKRAEGLGDKL